jgi:hypothetical protein
MKTAKRGQPVPRRKSGRLLSRDWNIGLVEDLQDRIFAREFLLAAVEEGVPLQIVLGKVIRAIGAKEFARKGTTMTRRA